MKGLVGRSLSEDHETRKLGFCIFPPGSRICTACSTASPLFLFPKKTFANCLIQFSTIYEKRKRRKFGPFPIFAFFSFFFAAVAAAAAAAAAAAVTVAAVTVSARATKVHHSLLSETSGIAKNLEAVLASLR